MFWPVTQFAASLAKNATTTPEAFTPKLYSCRNAAADIDDESPSYLPPVQPAAEGRYSSHSVSSQAVLRFAAECFGVRPGGWLQGIRPVSEQPFAWRQMSDVSLRLQKAAAS